MKNINGPLYQVEFRAVEVQLQELPGRHSAMFLRRLSWAEGLIRQMSDSLHQPALMRTLSMCSNFNYILFSKLPWPGDSEGTIAFTSPPATCPSVYHL